MRISTFLAAVLLASSPSQPNSLTVIRYCSRNTTVRDHVMITLCHGRRRSPPHVASFGTAQPSTGLGRLDDAELSTPYRGAPAPNLRRPDIRRGIRTSHQRVGEARTRCGLCRVEH